MTKLGKVLRYEARRQPVHPGEKVPLKLSQREREQILEHTFADDERIAPLRDTPASSKASVYSFTLDDLEELKGCVAAEANHAKDKKLQRDLDRLFERMEDVAEFVSFRQACAGSGAYFSAEYPSVHLSGCGLATPMQRR